MRDACLDSADKIRIRVCGCRYKTHAAKIPTIVDFPECRNAISKPRPPSDSNKFVKNSVIFRWCAGVESPKTEFHPSKKLIYWFIFH